MDQGFQDQYPNPRQDGVRYRPMRLVNSAERFVFREERDLIKKIQRFRLPAQPLQGGRHAGVCK